jgi:hypothetical protein
LGFGIWDLKGLLFGVWGSATRIWTFEDLGIGDSNELVINDYDLKHYWI